MSTTDELLWKRWDEVDRLLDQVLDQPAERRHAYLAAQAGPDRPLHDLVLRLLQRLAGDPDRLQAPAESLVRGAFSGDEQLRGDGELEQGTTVGRFVIVRFRGRGGMASVYEAHRADGTFEQRVALKVLRRGLDTDDLVARFLTERQILSSLTHANVARVLDGGALPDGRPFLVMELVDGEPITAWADARRLSLAQRLDLFVQVAGAVHAAHRQLVVHRDIKPSNILVTEDGEVKLLDFGIAKLLTGDGRDTATGVRLLTPDYASPEQLRGDVITTGSDIYQLGLLLRELLTGLPPLGGDTHPGEPPVHPSRLATLSLPSAPDRDVRATARDTTPQQLARTLRGDLDIIVGKALRADPEQRYASVEELSEDVRRYRQGRPILAHPESARYLVGKYLARNRWVLPTGIAALLAIGGFMTALTVQNRRLGRERDAAQLASRRAAATEEFLVEVLRSPDPTGATSQENPSARTVVEALQHGRRRLETELADQPEVRASLLAAIGATLSGLGRTEVADTVLGQSLQLHTQQYGATDERTLGVLRRIAYNFRESRRFTNAESVFQEELARRIARGPVADTTRANLLSAISAQRTLMQEPDSAMSYAAQAELLLRAAGDTAGRSYTNALGTLAPALRSVGQLDSAQRIYMRILERQLRDSTTPQLNIATTYNNLAYLQRTRGDLAAAESSYAESLRILRMLLGPGHPSTVLTGNNLAVTLEFLGRHDDVITLRRELISAVEAQWPEGAWQVGAAYVNLGRFHLRRNDPAAAIGVLRRGWESYRQTLGPAHDWTIIAEAQLGTSLIATRATAAGERHLDHAHAQLRARSAAPDAQLQGALSQLAAQLRSVGEARQAARFAAFLPAAR